jgi:hypothetical protein
MQSIPIQRIYGFAVTFLGLAFALMLGSWVGSGDWRTPIALLALMAGLGVVMALGSNYWMLIPLSLSVKFPALPLAGRVVEFPELAIAAVSVIYAARVALKKEKFAVFRPINTPFILFMAWVAMVFYLHPTGLSALGAGTIGARFYLKLALAFAAFIVLSNRSYSTRDIRWILLFLVAGSIFHAFYIFIEVSFAAAPKINNTGFSQEDFYTWQQALSIPAITVAFLIFSRWSPKEVFSLHRFYLIGIYCLCLALAIVSGKRMGLMAVIAAPIISSIMYRQPVYLLVGAILGTATLGTLSIGQGQWFQLPLVAQRTLSWIPGDWAPELDNLRGGVDDFRTELRRLALKNIAADPIIGKGFAIDISDVLSGFSMMEQGGGIYTQVAGHASSRNWHNIWLGYAADFGIPLSIIQAVIFMSMLFLSARLFKYHNNTNMAGVFALYVFIFTFRDVFSSHTSGHTALDSFDRWWMYGIIVSLYLQTLVSSKPSYKSGQQTGLPMARNRLTELAARS